MSPLTVISGDDHDALIEFYVTGDGGESRPSRALPAAAESLRVEAEALEGEIEQLGAKLAPGPRTLLELHAAAVVRERQAARARLLDELRVLVSRLTRHLQLDSGHGPQGRSPTVLSGVLGQAGGALDSDTLSRLLPEHRGTKRLSVERRTRLEQAGERLRAHLDAAEEGPALLLLHDGDWPADLELDGVEPVRTASSSMVQAVATFDESVGEVTELLRAVRLVRLELAGAFRPERHERGLARFDWRAVARDELPLFPRIAVLASAESVRQGGVGELSSLLTSDRPVHVLLHDHPAVADERVPRPRLEIGYVAAAHRDAFVLQSTLARPAQLAAGLARMAASPRPALAIVATPSQDPSSPSSLELVAAHHGRGMPCFSYDPEAGESWSACLGLEGNPQPERPWPVLELRHADDQGVEQIVEEPFTAAHAVAVTAAGRRHVRRVARTSWDERQVEIASFLELTEKERRGKLPFLWLVDDDGRLARGVVARTLTLVCRERLGIWRVLSELAGVNNEHARRAVEEVRRQSEAREKEATERLVSTHEDELRRVRDEAGQDAVGRIVQALLDFDGALPASTSPAVSSMPLEASPAELEIDVEEPSVVSAGPYIDTPLCTTCNECTNLNSRMFRYNEDKQAYLADLSAGTFAELVKAAEKCPARIIHPGVPRNGDNTVTDRLLARAAKFN